MSKHNCLVEDAVRDKNLHCVKFRDISDREYWENIPENYRRALVEEGGATLGQQWPRLLLSDFREFSRNGNRVHYESLFFDRIRMLDALVLAECVENQGRFLDMILDGLWLLLEQTTWCLPAHNNYIRDTPQCPLPRDAAPALDLFAAETAATIGLTECLLRPVFAKISPFISEYVNTELKRRIFVPYQNYHFWWMGDGESQMLNWTPWITQNILLAMLTREQNCLTEREITVIRDQAALSLDYFLDEYGEDGCCDEGAHYFSHAAVTLYTCLSLFEWALDDPSGIHEVYETDMIRNMAAYIYNMHVRGPYYINFADGSPYAGSRTAGEYCFAKSVGREDVARFAAADFRNTAPEQKLMPGELSLFLRLRQAVKAKEMLKEPDMNELPGDIFYESLGLMVARDSLYTLAVKAGDNGDNHNHNDVGSFILYLKDRPLFIDLGVGTYTKKTFSEERYTIWTMQSQYHNLPTFFKPNRKAVMQKDGREYAASDVRCDLTADEASITMDIAGAYPDRKIRQYIRTVTFRKNMGIEIFDHAESLLPFELSLMTADMPEVLNDPEQTVRIGSYGSFTVSGAESIRVEKIPITDAGLRKAWQQNVYRILITPWGNDLRIRLTE